MINVYFVYMHSGALIMTMNCKFEPEKYFENVLNSCQLYLTYRVSSRDSVGTIPPLFCGLSPLIFVNFPAYFVDFYCSMYVRVADIRG